MRVQRIAIVGAGLAGLACAVACAAVGAQVQVFEAASELVDPPASIDVVPNLLRDLEHLGLADACLRAGFAYASERLLDEQGQLRHERRLPRLASERCPPALGLRYGRLLQALAAAAQAHGAHLHFDTPVRGLRTLDTGGEALLLDAVQTPGFDLVLLAAGVDSPLRQQRFPAAVAAHPLGQHWWHALLLRPTGLDQPAWIIGPGREKRHMVPVAPDRAGVAVLRPASALAQAGTPDARAQALRQALRAPAGPASTLAATVAERQPVALRPVRTALLAGPWFSGGVLAVGEAAHTLPPHAGQPAAQGVEDALVLGELLRAGLPRPALLAAYSARRAPRATRIHAIALQAARWDLQPDPDTDLRALAAELDRVVAVPA